MRVGGKIGSTKGVTGMGSAHKIVSVAPPRASMPMDRAALFSMIWAKTLAELGTAKPVDKPALARDLKVVLDRMREEQAPQFLRWTVNRMKRVIQMQYRRNVVMIPPKLMKIISIAAETGDWSQMPNPFPSLDQLSEGTIMAAHGIQAKPKP